MSENAVHDTNGSATDRHTDVHTDGDGQPAPGQPDGARPQAPRGSSAPTVVFGLVLGVVAALVLGHELDLFEVDPVASGVWLLLGSGALLVVWALVSMVGRRDDSHAQAE